MIGSASSLSPSLSSLDFDPSTGTWFHDTPRTAQEITAWQLEKAWRLAENVAATNPFYAPRVALPTGRGADAFRSLPVTRKDDIVADRAAFPPYGLRTVVTPEHIRMVVETSGTSGLGTEVYALDQHDLDAIVRAEAVGFLWAGIRAGTRVLLTLPVGMSAAGLWYSAALRFIGANVFSVGPYPSVRKVEVLRQFDAEVLIGTPTYVQRLAVVCEDLGFPPAATSIRTIVVAGQPFSHAWAAGIERRWNAELYEQYGCTERAFAWTCPGGVVEEGGLRVLHFPPESGYYEVLSRDSGEPVAHGEKGELIVTPFEADSSPLLRYATGDQVRWMAPGSCSCGRPLAGIAAGEVERFDDMMKIKGVNVWPVAFDRAVFAVDGVSDYRGAVVTAEDGSEQIEIRVEGTGDPQRLRDAIATSIRGATGLTAHIVLEPPGTLAREVPEGFVKVKRMQDRREWRLG